MGANEVVLFQQIELSDIERERTTAAEALIDNLPEADVITSARDQAVAENILERLTLQAPTLFEPEEPRAFTEKVQVNDGFGGRFHADRKFAELVIPFAGDGRPFHFRPPGQHYATVLHASLCANTVRHVISMDHKSVEQGATELSTFWRELKASMEVLRSDLKATNERLRRKVTPVAQ
jgi:hypothetical protein